MIGQTQRERNSALDDLSDGMRLLLGFERSRPNFIQALLDDLDEGRPAWNSDTSQRTVKHRRLSGSSNLRLVRVEKL